MISTVLITSAVQAQRLPMNWRVTAEVGGVIGGTWLTGPQAPTVGGDLGVTLGVGALRSLVPNAAAGVALRLGSQGLTVTEQDASWSGGTLTEADVVGVLALTSRRRARAQLSLDVGGGLAFLSSARDLLPFRGAVRASPLGEIGLAVRRAGLVKADAPRRDLALFARYSALRVGTAATSVDHTSGWIGRISVGLRVTR